MPNISSLRAFFSRETLVFLYNLLKSILQNFTMSQPSSPPPPPPHPPPPFNPLEPSIPISYPIKTLQDLESRIYFDSFHFPFNRSSVPLQWNRDRLPDRPRILVCHDMKGGYVDDRWVQGSQNDAVYAIWHWHLMDVFVYFSHSLVTLPPPCWTNSAHRHGVKVLGTFITEWDEGKAICKTLLATKESAQTYAERLAELADSLRFDGWLINIENRIDATQIPNLKEFVCHLTKTMHSLVPGSLVIWYDSVTIYGDLKWQDQLNGKNKPFFDLCDGIFMNYTWKENYPKLSANLAGDRKHDVYMGIDVFGRGTFGGGQWNMKVALDLLKKNNVSAAIFAPGWIFETEQPPNFNDAQNRWWALIEESWGVLQTYPKFLPFYSDFDQGHGYHISSEGFQLAEAPWFNISCQSLQPFLDFEEKPAADDILVSVVFKEASFNGGGNITFRGTLEENGHFIARLFKANLHLGDSLIHVSYSVKSDKNSRLGLLLHFSSANSERKSVLLASCGTNKFPSRLGDSIVQCPVTSSKTASEWRIEETSFATEGYTLAEISAVCYRPEEPDMSRLRSESSNAQVDYFALLGHISIKASEHNSDFPPSSSWFIEGQYIEYKQNTEGSKTVSGMVAWRLKDGNDLNFPKYYICMEKLSENMPRKILETREREKEFLGVAHVNAYYFSDLAVPSGTTSLRFTIQAFAADGCRQKLDESPSFLLNVKGQ